MKDIKNFIEISDGIADPLRRGMLAKIDFLQSTMVRFPMEEAIEFAKKYLADRKKDSTTGSMPIDLTPFRDVLHTEQAWDLAVEYILDDIIPYLYGEALD